MSTSVGMRPLWLSVARGQGRTTARRRFLLHRSQLAQPAPAVAGAGCGLSRCHPLLSRDAPILYATPMPTDHQTSFLRSHQPRHLPVPARPGSVKGVKGVTAPAYPAALRTLPGGCFARPLRGPLSLSGGCSSVVSRGTRFVAAPRGSNPPSRNNPQAGLSPRWPDEKTSPTWPRSTRGTTANQPQSCFGPSLTSHRHGAAGENVRERNETKRHSGGWGPAGEMG